ncbi:MAG: sensor histidine kinase [Myxococcaceae bacterium]
MKKRAQPTTFSIRSLRPRVLILVGIGVLLPAAVLGVLGAESLDELTDRTLAERGRWARFAADRLEQVLRYDLEMLQGVSAAPRVNLEDADPEPERGALRQAYLSRHLMERVFLLNDQGGVMWEEPVRGGYAEQGAGRLPVTEALQSGRPKVTGLVTDAHGARRMYALVPLRNWHGKVVGLAGGVFDPKGSRFLSALGGTTRGQGASLDVVDGNGVVLASSDSARVFQPADHGRFLASAIAERREVIGGCHGCHEGEIGKEREREVMAFAPLTEAPWGIDIREGEAQAFAPVRTLWRRLLWLGPLLIGGSLVFAWGAARSVQRPVKVLTRAAERIAGGELDQPIPPLGADEVGSLGRSFESMRVALASSLARIEQAKDELEARVEERTRQLADLNLKLAERDASRGELLRKAIAAQEEERKRIARELHDETSQSLVALVMRLERAKALVQGSQAQAPLEEVKALAVRTLDEVHRLILDLRPSVLDDLGLPSAIRWNAERALKPRGVSVRCELDGLEGRLPTEMETALFRAVQETMNNIARHAEAESVLVQSFVRSGRLTIEIEDDGKGFDPAILNEAGRPRRPLGLLGLRERMDLLGGTVEIDSAPGKGTRVALSVPIPKQEPR